MICAKVERAIGDAPRVQRILVTESGQVGVVYRLAPIDHECLNMRDVVTSFTGKIAAVLY